MMFLFEFERHFIKTTKLFYEQNLSIIFYTRREIS